MRIVPSSVLKLNGREGKGKAVGSRGEKGIGIGGVTPDGSAPDLVGYEDGVL